MSEIEELKKKLEEMERENADLRRVLNRKPRVKTFPPEIMQRYPSLNNLYNGYASSDPWMSLAKAIRMVLFPESKRKVLRGGKNADVNIRCQDMDEIQYSLYLETLDSVLSALSIGRENALKAMNKEEIA